MGNTGGGGTVLKIIIVALIVVLIVNYSNKKTINSIKETRSITSSSEEVTMKELYSKTTDFEKSELYFNHRLDIVIRKKYPNLIFWKTVRCGVSLRNQAIEVIIYLPDNEEKRIWISSDQLIGSFHFVDSEFSEDEILCDNEPNDEIRLFLIKYASVIDKKIRFAVEKKIVNAYFEFRDGESEEFMQKVCDRLTTTLDGVMCQLRGTQLEMNVQNMLDD